MNQSRSAVRAGLQAVLHLVILVSNLVLATLVALLLVCVRPASGNDDAVQTARAERLSLPMTEWPAANGERDAYAYLIAIHGLSLHGHVYNRLGEKLSARGITTVAPDLRGYGGWARFSEGGGADTKRGDIVDYNESLTDLMRITDDIKCEHPNTPIYVLGESLGASMAVQLAAHRPEAIDGLILSAPGVKLHHCFSLNMLPGVMHMLVAQKHQLDIAPYLRKHFSNDDAIVFEHLSDQTVRTRFSIRDILSTCKVVRQTLKVAPQVPGHVPVLILQGGQDKMLKPAGAQLLRISFARHDADLLSLPAAGHILLETSKPNTAAMSAVDSWLNKQITRRSFVASAPLRESAGSVIQSGIPISNGDL